MSKFQVTCSCVKCKQITSTGQLSRSHVKKCPVPTPRVQFIGGFGRKAWNTGLSLETDERLRIQGAASSLTKRLNPRRLTQEEKDHLSIVAKKIGLGGYRAGAGRSKKFKVYDSFGNQTTLQSTFEYACFEVLCELGIRWVRPGALKYGDKNYFADFHLVDFDIWLDPKNDYKAKCDAEKIAAVIEQNKVKLFVLSEKQITKEYIGRVIQR